MTDMKKQMDLLTRIEKVKCKLKTEDKDIDEIKNECIDLINNAYDLNNDFDFLEKSMKEFIDLMRENLSKEDFQDAIFGFINVFNLEEHGIKLELIKNKK